MSTRGFSAEIHKVADNGRQLALFLGAACLFGWIVALNISINDLTPRWFQRQFEWLSAETIPPIFVSMAIASLLAAGVVWLFSGHGNKVFDIDAVGITRNRLLGSKTYLWSDFELLEREVSTLVLHLKPSVKEKFGPGKIRFDLSGIDCTGPRLESLIVHYRPDLYRILHVAKPKRDGEPAPEAVAAPVVAAPAPQSALSERIARLR